MLLQFDTGRNLVGEQTARCTTNMMNLTSWESERANEREREREREREIGGGGRGAGASLNTDIELRLCRYHDTSAANSSLAFKSVLLTDKY